MLHGSCGVGTGLRKALALSLPSVLQGVTLHQEGREASSSFLVPPQMARAASAPFCHCPRAQKLCQELACTQQQASCPVQSRLEFIGRLAVAFMRTWKCKALFRGTFSSIKGGKKKRESLHLSNKTPYEYVSHSALRIQEGFSLVSNHSKSREGAMGAACRESRAGERYPRGLSLEYVLAAQQFEI